MAVTKSDMVLAQSLSVIDGSSNGGRRSYNLITNRTMFNEFPRVSRPERLNGVTRYRKAFLWNQNAAGDIAFSVYAYNLMPTPAGDKVYICGGTPSDIQSAASAYSQWTGGGQLNANITAGAQVLAIIFDNNDYYIGNGTKIALNSNFMTSQSMDASAAPFQGVMYSGSSWIAQSAPSADTEDIYPYGTYLGNGVVFSYNSAGHLEYLTVQNNGYTGEVVGAGNGTNKTFNAHTCSHPPILPNSVTIHYTIGSTPYTATDNGSGVLSGQYLTSGTINNTTGAINLTFSTAPDNSTNITVDYTTQAWSWSGNVCTINTVEQIANNYTASNSYAAMCVQLGNIGASYDTYSKTSSAGTFDPTKIVLSNLGSVEDTFTITFTSPTAFICSGALEGSLSNGAIGTQYAPNNVNISNPYFTIPTASWGGTWTAGDTIQFHTHAGAAALWTKEVVPVNTAAYSPNGWMIEYYVE
ncbi:MAG: hypothetical protein HQK93_03375 [Nitrospirae bacterium]|nr:hypothetical protein [Nitrospirota bacterium]